MKLELVFLLSLFIFLVLVSLFLVISLSVFNHTKGIRAATILLVGDEITTRLQKDVGVMQ